jgi:hypothetical protein
MPEQVKTSDVAHAQRANQFGARFALRIILECRRYNLPISLGFALFEQESNFENVFGHDPTVFIGAGNVTRAKYTAYKARRLASGNRLMQGVGPGQLTWWETQDVADEIGGSWNPATNVRVSIMTLAARIKEHGYAKGIERYNGSGPRAQAYSISVRARAQKWHDRLA